MNVEYRTGGAIGESQLPWTYLGIATLVWNEKKRQQEIKKSVDFVNSLI